MTDRLTPAAAVLQRLRRSGVPLPTDLDIRSCRPTHEATTQGALSWYAVRPDGTRHPLCSRWPIHYLAGCVGFQVVHTLDRAYVMPSEQDRRYDRHDLRDQAQQRRMASR